MSFVGARRVGSCQREKDVKTQQVRGENFLIEEKILSYNEFSVTQLRVGSLEKILKALLFDELVG
jgi:hypothetical protein